MTSTEKSRPSRRLLFVAVAALVAIGLAGSLGSEPVDAGSPEADPPAVLVQTS